MREHYPQFRQAPAEVVAISFEPLFGLRQLSQELHLPFPLLSDPARATYRAYALLRGSLWAVLRPKVLGFYLARLLQGRGFALPRSDPYQLGGDVIIDPQGIIRYRYLSQDPADRPPVAELLSTVRRWSGGVGSQDPR